MRAARMARWLPGSVLLLGAALLGGCWRSESKVDRNKAAQPRRAIAEALMFMSSDTPARHGRSWFSSMTEVGIRG